MHSFLCLFVAVLVRSTWGNHEGQQVPQTGEEQHSFVFIQKINTCLIQSVNSGALYCSPDEL